MTADFVPNVVVVAGPNGSGKSTAAPGLLRDYLGVLEFVNADTIAAGLSGFRAEAVALQAGRMMLARLRQLAKQRVDFAFETTLAARFYAPWIENLRQTGYVAHLLFLWLPSAEMAVGRVKTRVQQGGHDVPESVVRRRYQTGLRNLFRLYLPIVDSWMLFDTSAANNHKLIACENKDNGLHVANPSLWQSLQETYR